MGNPSSTGIFQNQSGISRSISSNNRKEAEPWFRLLTLIADHGEDVGITAAALALEEGCPTVEAVENIINRLLEPAIPVLKTKEIPLTNPPTGDCSIYNSLLKGTSHATH